MKNSFNIHFGAEHLRPIPAGAVVQLYESCLDKGFEFISVTAANTRLVNDLNSETIIEIMVPEGKWQETSKGRTIKMVPWILINRHANDFSCTNVYLKKVQGIG
jgi:hypothetical protein